MPCLHPADRPEVPEGFPEAAPVGVFAFARGARAVVHGDFRDACAGHGHQRGNEPMQAAELHGQGPGPAGAERLEGAAGVADLLAQDEVADGVGQAAADALGPDVLAPGAVAAAKIAMVQLGHERRHVGRVILAVGVEGDEDFALRGLEGGAQRGALPGVPRQPQDLQFGDLGLKRLQPEGGAIRRAIVHDDDFRGLGQTVQDAGGFPDDGGDAIGFVERGNQDRQGRPASFAWAGIQHGGSGEGPVPSPNGMIRTCRLERGAG